MKKLTLLLGLLIIFGAAQALAVSTAITINDFSTWNLMNSTNTIANTSGIYLINASLPGMAQGQIIDFNTTQVFSNLSMNFLGPGQNINLTVISVFNAKPICDTSDGCVAGYNLTTDFLDTTGRYDAAGQGSISAGKTYGLFSGENSTTFNSGSSQYVNSTAALNTSTAFSISFYFKFIPGAAGQFGGLVGFYNATKSRNFLIYYDVSSKILGCSIRNITGSGNSCAGKIIPLNTWHSFTGVANTTHFIWYIDGIWVQSLKIAGGYAAHQANTELRLGRGDDYYNGSLSYVYIYNRTLTASEIYNQSTMIKCMNNATLCDISGLPSSQYLLLNNVTLDTGLGTNVALTGININGGLGSPVIYPYAGLTVNMSKTIGIINPYFYGVNTHSFLSLGVNLYNNTGSDSGLDSNQTWHRETFTASGLNYIRDDMSLQGSSIDGLGNGDFEFWNDPTTDNKNIFSATDPFEDWIDGGSTSGNIIFCNLTYSTDAHKGGHSMKAYMMSNGTCSCYPHQVIYLGGNSTLYYTAWIKTNNTVTFKIINSSYSNVHQINVNASLDWQYIQSATFTTQPTDNQHKILIELNDNDSVIWDDVHIIDNSTGKDYIYIGDISAAQDRVSWAFNNSYKILYILDYTPHFLANRTSDCYYPQSRDSTNSSRCDILNYTQMGEVVTKYINKVSSSGKYNSSVEVEVWNEPYGGFWMPNVTSMSLKAARYLLLYNESYNAIKAIYPNMKVGGPAGYYESSAGINFTNDVMAYFNSTNQTDFLSVHTYAGTTLGSTMVTDMSNIYLNYTTLANKPIFWSEWNDNSASRKANDSKAFASVLANSYISILNLYPATTQLMLYHWAEAKNYTAANLNSYPEYPAKWEMVSEPYLSNALWASYNITKQIATKHVPGATVYNTTSNTSGLIITQSKKNTGKAAVTVVNTGAYIYNVSISLAGGTTVPTLTREDGTIVSGSGNVFNLGIFNPNDAYTYNYTDCVTPFEDYTVNVSTTLCPGTYYLNDTNGNGAIRINANNIILDCDSAKLVGDSTVGSWGISLNSKNNVTIKNCVIDDGYKYGILVFNGENNSITNNTFQNQKNSTSVTMTQLRVAGTSKNVVIRNNTFKNNSNSVYFLTTSIDQANSLFIGNKILDGRPHPDGTNAYNQIYISGSNYTNITNNVFANGEVAIMISATTNAESVRMINIDNNSFFNLTKSPLRNDSIANYPYITFIDATYRVKDLIIQNNIFNLSDIGIRLLNTSDSVIKNNVIDYTITNGDTWCVGIHIGGSNNGTRGSSNILIKNNTILNWGTGGVLVSSSRNVTIDSNYFQEMNWTDKLAINTTDWMEPPVAIQIMQAFKGSDADGDTYEENWWNISDMQKYTSSNINIYNNTFSKSTQVYLRNQGGIGVTHDLTNVWYRKFSELSWLVNASEWYISTNYTNVSTVIDWFGINNNPQLTLMQGWRFSSIVSWYNITNTKLMFVGRASSNPSSRNYTSIELYNLSAPYNDIYNASNGKKIYDNVASATVTLGAGNQIIVGDYGNGSAGCLYNVFDDYTVNVSTTLCPGTYYLNDTGAVGIIISNTNNAIIDCNGSTFIGNNSGTAFNLSNKMANVTNCRFINYSRGITIAVPSGVNRWWTINNSYFLGNNRGINILDGGRNYTMQNNTFINNVRGIYVDGGNNYWIQDSIFTNSSIMTNVKSGMYIWIERNTFNGTTLINTDGTGNVYINKNTFLDDLGKHQIGINQNADAGSSWIYIENNTIGKSDNAVYVSKSSNVFITNNFIDNATANADGYNVGIYVMTNSSNITIVNNTINYGHVGIWVQSSKNVSIINTTCNQISLTSINNGAITNARTGWYHYYEPTACVLLGEQYEGWLGDSSESINDGYSKFVRYNVTDAHINNIIANSNVQTYLHTVGVFGNADYTLPTSWYAKFLSPINMTDADEFYNNPSWNVLQIVPTNTSGIQSILKKNRAGMSNTGYDEVNYSISKTQLNFTNTLRMKNNLSVFNLSAPYNDIWNASNSKLLAYNQTSYSLTLGPSDQIIVGQYASFLNGVDYSKMAVPARIIFYVNTTGLNYTVGRISATNGICIQANTTDSFTFTCDGDNSKVADFAIYFNNTFGHEATYNITTAYLDAPSGGSAGGAYNPPENGINWSDGTQPEDQPIKEPVPPAVILTLIIGIVWLGYWLYNRWRQSL